MIDKYIELVRNIHSAIIDSFFKYSGSRSFFIFGKSSFYLIRQVSFRVVVLTSLTYQSYLITELRIFSLKHDQLKIKLIVTASNQSSDYFNNITMILLNVRTVKELNSDLHVEI
jgi:hypothetical protein